MALHLLAIWSVNTNNRATVIKDVQRFLNVVDSYACFLREAGIGRVGISKLVKEGFECPCNSECPRGGWESPAH